MTAKCGASCSALGGPALPRFPCVAASRAAGCSRGRHCFGTSSSVGGRHINSLHLDIARGISSKALKPPSCTRKIPQPLAKERSATITAHQSRFPMCSLFSGFSAASPAVSRQHRTNELIPRVTQPSMGDRIGNTFPRPKRSPPLSSLRRVLCTTSHLAVPIGRIPRGPTNRTTLL